MFGGAVSEWQPLYNPVSNLVSRATGNTAKYVFVAGEQVVDSGRLTKVEQDHIMCQVRDTSQRIAGRLDMKNILKLRWPIA